MSFTPLVVRNVAPVMARTISRCGQLSFRRPMSSSPPSRPFKIHVGASFAGKPSEFRTTLSKQRKPLLDFPSDSDIALWRAEMLAIPKAVRSSDAGEDFFYVQEMRNHSGVSFGVADGVGGWVDVGVDPSLFAQALMYHSHRYSKQSWAGEPEINPLDSYEEREQVEGWELTPRECLELAHGAVLREKTVNAGSSTACLINVNASNGLLRAANLGDSGFCIFRSSNLYYYQMPQNHFFNCPKQLSKVPSYSRRLRNAFMDSAWDADLYETKVRSGDIIVAYTDGLSDNVFSHEMLQICTLISRSSIPESRQAQDIADKLVLYARSCMMKEDRVSPFEIASARVGQYLPGGKIDDVTVVAAVIEETA